MRDILSQIRRWEEPFALATVVSTWRSAPRPPGAAMAVNAAGELVGSVSGGCVEGAVYELCREVIETGRTVVASYGVGDDEAFAVGLTCGGSIQVLVRRVDPRSDDRLRDLVEAVDAHRPAALATTIEPSDSAPRQLLIVGGDRRGAIGDEGLDEAVAGLARRLLARGQTGIVHVGEHGEERRDGLAVFVESFAPPARMLIFGANDFAAALARMCAFLGYRVTVCDARPVFATRDRLPAADEIVVGWPHDDLATAEVDARTVICVLTHDPKFDVPLLEAALRTEAGYIGVMGSRRTHTDRAVRLAARGLGDSDLSRLHSPIGLDLGARTPQETAVSIVAEIVAELWGGSGQPLAGMKTSIHASRSRK